MLAVRGRPNLKDVERFGNRSIYELYERTIYERTIYERTIEGEPSIVTIVINRAINELSIYTNTVNYLL